MNRDIEDQLYRYTELVESLADRLSRRDRNERDDLIQEGMIAAWEALREDNTPTEELIEKRMRKWLRYRGRQKRDVPANYDTLLRLEG
jgi:DNA-directed RNA polymerase specialized sigma subunit